MSDVLNIITVYDHPRDYPHEFVARVFVVDHNGANPTGLVLKADALDRLHDLIQQTYPGVVRLARDPDDVPVILESWA